MGSSRRHRRGPDTMAYDIYCAFDLEKHKQTYVQYLEVVILEDGTVEYAVPSHQEKLIALWSIRLAEGSVRRDHGLLEATETAWIYHARRVSTTGRGVHRSAASEK